MTDMVMAPREPTEAMLEAAANRVEIAFAGTKHICFRTFVGYAYDAMIAASPALSAGTGGEVGWLVERTDGHMPGPYAHFRGKAVFWLPDVNGATRFETREAAEGTDEVRRSGGAVRAVEHVFNLALANPETQEGGPRLCNVCEGFVPTWGVKVCSCEYHAPAGTHAAPVKLDREAVARINRAVARMQRKAADLRKNDKPVMAADLEEEADAILALLHAGEEMA